MRIPEIAAVHKQVALWKQNVQATILEDFCAVFQVGFTPKAIRKGFKNASISPPNPKITKLHNT